MFKNIFFAKDKIKFKSVRINLSFAKNIFKKRIIMKLIKLGLASILASSALFAGTYNVDQAHSSVDFKVKHLMLSNVKGNFKKFSGSFEYDEKTKTLKYATGIIEASSVNTENEKRDEHLRADDMLGSKKYPQIKFKLTNIDGDKAYGDLTIRDITKKVKFDFENNGALKDPWGNERAAFALDGKINRKDFGLTYNDLLESGGLVVGDIVKLNIEIEGIKTK